jgi:hypothetical protein
MGLDEVGLPTRIYAPAGCDACGNTGYSGRIGVFEVVVIDNEIRRLIQIGAGTQEIRAWASANGIRFLRDDALDKVRLGLTSLDEVLRVVPMQERASLPCRSCGKELVGNFAFCPHCGIRTRETAVAAVPHAAGNGGVTR